MKITIHRGTNQIGGCITEIQSAKGDKILIDFGHNLPEGDKPAQDKYDEEENVLNLLEGVSDVYYTHYHGDHISFESEIYRAGVTQHIGALSFEMIKTLKQHMQHADSLKERATKSLEALEHFKVYKPKHTETVGDIRITPYFVSHSAIDAHMFLIECDGITILHTGDFRDHGYMGKGLEKNLIANIVPKQIDVLVTEGTMLSRIAEKVPTEWDLQKKTIDIFNKYKNAFVLCSSMDADRIVTMYQATRKQKKYRWFVTDSYQGEQIRNIRMQLTGIYSDLCYGDILVQHDDILEKMLENGFTMLVRNTDTFRKLLKEIMPHIDVQQTVFIYSQFEGYINKALPTFKQSTYDFVHSYGWAVEHVHTSGHASPQTLKKVCELVRPSMAIIPIHKEKDSNFAGLQLASELQDKIVTQSKCFEKQVGSQKVRVEVEIKE